MVEDINLAAKDCLNRKLTPSQCAREELAVWNAVAAQPSSSFELLSPRTFIDSIAAQEKAETENSLAANQGLARLFGSALDFIQSSFTRYMEVEGRNAKECAENPASCGMMSPFW